MADPKKRLRQGMFVEIPDYTGASAGSFAVSDVKSEVSPCCEAEIVTTGDDRPIRVCGKCVRMRSDKSGG